MARDFEYSIIPLLAKLKIGSISLNSITGIVDKGLDKFIVSVTSFIEAIVDKP